MNKHANRKMKVICLLLLPVLLVLGAMPAYGLIEGLTGTTFNLTAKTGYIIPDDGATIFIWGYASDVPNVICPAGGCMQYPGPALIVNQGDTVTINLTNQLPVATSIVFPGQTGVTATGGTPGLLTNEAAPAGGTVSYTFVASEPGTYIYNSGTRQDLQVEMGLFGAIIVRPALGANYAYNNPDTLFDREYLLLISEIDPVMHQQVEFGQMASVDNTKAFPVYWFVNGRAGFDTLLDSFIPTLPAQPYRALVLMHPAENILVRMIGAVRDCHPYHLHGNHHRVIARDGRLLGGNPANGELLFTSTVCPGGTTDSFFSWTGERLGWDVYGPIDTTCTDVTPRDGLDDTTGAFCHNVCVDVSPADGFDDVTHEYCADHGKTIPVELPNVLDVANGLLFAGSPFLGTAGVLPPGEGGFNPNSGLGYMWHSHSEKELTSNNIFPGGMLTFGIVERLDVSIP